MKLDCGCLDWEHELFNGACPPPARPRLCCGAPAGAAWDDERPCVNGYCIEVFCLACGAFQGMGWGPVGCGCANRKAWSRPHPEQRPKRPVPGGRVLTRKYRARRGR